jgi:hypothetical protein
VDEERRQLEVEEEAQAVQEWQQQWLHSLRCTKIQPHQNVQQEEQAEAEEEQEWQRPIRLCQKQVEEHHEEQLHAAEERPDVVQALQLCRWSCRRSPKQCKLHQPEEQEQEQEVHEAQSVEEQHVVVVRRTWQSEAEEAVQQEQAVLQSLQHPLPVEQVEAEEERAAEAEEEQAQRPSKRHRPLPQLPRHPQLRRQRARLEMPQPTLRDLRHPGRLRTLVTLSSTWWAWHICERYSSRKQSRAWTCWNYRVTN